MIIVEIVDDGTRERRYSDKGVKLRQIETGNIYDDAVDVIPCKYTYEETDEPVDPEPEEILQEDMMANMFVPNQFRGMINNS